MSNGYEVAKPLDKTKKNPNRETLPGVGDSVAKAWLVALKTSVRRDLISVLPYGSPSATWLKDAAPNELKFYQSQSLARGTEFFGGQGLTLVRVISPRCRACPTWPGGELS